MAFVFATSFICVLFGCLPLGIGIYVTGMLVALALLIFPPLVRRETRRINKLIAEEKEREAAIAYRQARVAAGWID